MKIDPHSFNPDIQGPTPSATTLEALNRAIEQFLGSKRKQAETVLNDFSKFLSESQPKGPWLEQLQEETQAALNRLLDESMDELESELSSSFSPSELSPSQIKQTLEQLKNQWQEEYNAQTTSPAFTASSSVSATLPPTRGDWDLAFNQLNNKINQMPLDDPRRDVYISVRDLIRRWSNLNPEFIWKQIEIEILRFKPPGADIYMWANKPHVPPLKRSFDFNDLQELIKLLPPAYPTDVKLYPPTIADQIYAEASQAIRFYGGDAYKNDPNYIQAKNLYLDLQKLILGGGSNLSQDDIFNWAMKNVVNNLANYPGAASIPNALGQFIGVVLPLVENAPVKRAIADLLFNQKSVSPQSYEYQLMQKMLEQLVGLSAKSTGDQISQRISNGVFNGDPNKSIYFQFIGLTPQDVAALCAMLADRGGNIKLQPPALGAMDQILLKTISHVRSGNLPAADLAMSNLLLNEILKNGSLGTVAQLTQWAQSLVDANSFTFGSKTYKFNDLMTSSLAIFADSTGAIATCGQVAKQILLWMNSLPVNSPERKLAMQMYSQISRLDPNQFLTSVGPALTGKVFNGNIYFKYPGLSPDILANLAKKIPFITPPPYTPVDKAYADANNWQKTVPSPSKADKDLFIGPGGLAEQIFDAHNRGESEIDVVRAWAKRVVDSGFNQYPGITPAAIAEFKRMAGL